MRWPSSIWNINLTGSSGKSAGMPAGLQKIKEKVKEDLSEVGWKKFYNRELFPVFGSFLKKHAEEQASLHSKTGLLAKSIVIGTGGLGRGKQAFRVVVKGEAANYARIINWGGIIRAKKKYLTVPIGDNIDENTGGKVIGMRQIKKGEGFTISQKEGMLGGHKIVYLKGDAIERHGFKAYARPGRKFSERIKPVFELVKFIRIKGNNWAETARENATASFNEYAIQKIKEFISR
jgi:hypothetical protein